MNYFMIFMKRKFADMVSCFIWTIIMVESFMEIAGELLIENDRI